MGLFNRKSVTKERFSEGNEDEKGNRKKRMFKKREKGTL